MKTRKNRSKLYRKTTNSDASACNCSVCVTWEDLAGFCLQGAYVTFLGAAFSDFFLCSSGEEEIHPGIEGQHRALIVRFLVTDFFRQLQRFILT
jgi:hypothetical protein